MPNETGAWTDDSESDGQDEQDPLHLPPAFRTLSFSETRLSVRDLWGRYVRGQLVLEPDFQRHYVWDAPRAGRYIESLLLALPTPAIFVSEDGDGRWIVLDGHQRMESLFRYLHPLLAGAATGFGGNAGDFRLLSPLTLKSLEVMTELNGTLVTSLDVSQREALWGRLITVVCLASDSHPDMKYALFARLNQGSMSLNPQELRNCLYRGPYNTLIQRLGEDRPFLDIWGKQVPDKRMRDRERVLRFFALLHRRDKYRSPFRAFLNDEMANLQHCDPDQARELAGQLEMALKWTTRIFGGEPFCQFRIGAANNPAGQWVRRRMDTLFEVEMVGFAHFGATLDQAWDALGPDDQAVFRAAIRHRLIDIMANERFLETINEGVARPDNIEKRFDLWIGQLASVLRKPDEAIARERSLLQQLRKSNVCTRCPNPILPDDAVTAAGDDGIHPVHRYCRRVGRRQ